MSFTLLSKVQTADGEVTVITKARFLLLLGLSRTSVMPSRLAELGHLGVLFQWASDDPACLERLHNLLLQALREGVGISDLRGIADIAKQFLSSGLPFIPADAPLPDALKQVGKHVKRVI